MSAMILPDLTFAIGNRPSFERLAAHRASGFPGRRQAGKPDLRGIDRHGRSTD
jgi:hypothetical protein